ncbi:hypothetical protein NQ166_05110 [Microbacterium sp. zg.Y1090]|uniref:hypothetical protein n=1 Tax=Microbacterium TaxID=33882 RepID=UPI00214A9AC4|nr:MULTISPECIES: hypothetical protein [unclassified Microbacterium]MCR2813451.1 hypothetical protein [Microbacterium sp. zg.Y1084]MCR2818213.1 hypothetical protein [Microbacterium sp. zg.Y1090]MDL5486734.1 hypothetical protein [Microbacterium sp. zg-Y1211]WIM27639.1 hypothetical protein QNO26_10805 [Microbacterium sp. zg-Y1090]
MTTRQARTLRGAAGAGVATLVAATAHTLSGGGAPGPLLVVAVACLATPLAVLLSGGRSALWRTTLVVGGAQALFHGAFAIAGDARTLPGGGHAHHHIDDIVAPAAGTVASTETMPLGHLIAAVVTIAALRHGERLLRRLGRGILRLTSRRLPALRPSPAAPTVPPAPCARLGSRRLALSALSRRGPPVFAR